MTRMPLLALGIILTIGLTTSADDPKPDTKKPQWQRLLTGDDAKTAAKLQQQIDDLCAKDDYASAIKSGEELLALRTKEQGEDHHETVSLKHENETLRKIATAPAGKRQEWRAVWEGTNEAGQLEAKGRYAQALPLRQTHLKWCRELLGEEHPETANSYNNVASNLDAQWKCSEAQPLHQKALDIRRKVLGEEHPYMATSYNNVATNLYAQGKYAEAQPLYQKALDIRRKVRGEEHPDTAFSYYTVAYNLDAQGKYAEALPLYQKALDIRRKVRGEEHPDTVTSYDGLGINLSRQGKYAEAQPLLQKALEIRRKVRGEEHPDTATSYDGLGINLSRQGKYAEAQPLLEKALEIHRKVRGEEHPDTALSYSNVASNLNTQGKYAEAQPLYQKALEIYRKVLGEEHPYMATSYNNVATNLDAQGKYAEAQPLYQKALEIYRKVLGEEHPYMATSYNNVATNLDAQGKYAEAQPLYQKALDIRRKVLGEEHPQTASSYYTVAYNLDAQGKYAEALPLYEKALEIHRKVLGEEHPQTAHSYNGAAVNLYAQRRYAEAQPLLEKALEIRRKVLGEEHPDTAMSYSNVAFNLSAQGKSAEAEAILKRGIHSYETSRLAGASGLDRSSLRNFNPRLLLAVMQQAGDPNEAWRSIELSLARGLLDQQAALKDPVEQAEQTRERNRVATLQPQILALITKAERTDMERVTLQSLLNERREAEERLAVLEVAASQREVTNLDAIRKALPADVAFLFWVDVFTTSGDLGEHWSCAVRSVGDPKWERLPSTRPDKKWSAEDEELPRKLREALAQSASQLEVESLVKQLRIQRIAPVIKHLEGVKTLYVVPVNKMAGVPVELLLPNLTVGYVPSGTFLARAKGQAPLTNQKMLALGDPVFTRPDDKPAARKTLPSGGLLITQVIPDGVAAKARLLAGDVLLKYGDTDLTNVDNLKAAIAAKEKAASIPVTVWRETADKPFVRDVAPGMLGVVLDRDPAPIAVANRRKTDTMLQALQRGGWQELPGTRVETNRLRQLLGEDCQVLTDSAASEQNLEAMRKSGELLKFRYLHFATHGEGNSVMAFESALILAQDKLPKDAIPKVDEPYINGQLSAGEVLKFWKLNAELVTLSACETAIGKEAGGDGMLGFAQAFLTAGSRSVCLSLWKVDDTATALLMDRFYQNLLGKREGLAKPLGKAAALDEAKRWLRNLSGEEALALTAKISKGVARGTRSKDEELKLAVPSTDPKSPTVKDSKPFAHPSYWAAFVLIGDPN